MLKFKNFLNAKKGKELVEIIILAPIMVFLIMFTAVNLICYISKGEAEDVSSDLTRISITERSYYNALVSLAKEIDSKYSDTTILNITVTNTEGTETTMSFSDNPDETTYFHNLIVKENDKVTSFNTNVSDSFNRKYIAMSTAWERGNYITLKVQKCIAPEINKISKFSIYNFSTKKNETLNFGVSGVIECKTSGVIIG